ncbi:MAG: SgcJ/EcaC family oxidoreductase [Stackebrandtia sp.]
MNISADINDTTAVQNLFQRIQDMWAAADAVGYAECFTPDVDYVTFIGTHMKGHKQVIDSHEALWTTFQKNTRLHQVLDSLRFITPDVAVLVTRGAILQPKQQEPKRGDWKIQTLVALRTEDGWRFTSFQNTKHRWLFEKLGARRDQRLSPNS